MFLRAFLTITALFEPSFWHLQKLKIKDLGLCKRADMWSNKTENASCCSEVSQKSMFFRAFPTMAALFESAFWYLQKSKIKDLGLCKRADMWSKLSDLTRQKMGHVAEKSIKKACFFEHFSPWQPFSNPLFGTFKNRKLRIWACANGRICDQN